MYNEIQHMQAIPLKCGKAAWSDDLCAEYFKFANHKLSVLNHCVLLYFVHTFLYAFIND